jgi:hypothetical protein
MKYILKNSRKGKYTLAKNLFNIVIYKSHYFDTDPFRWCYYHGIMPDAKSSTIAAINGSYKLARWINCIRESEGYDDDYISE